MQLIPLDRGRSVARTVAATLIVLVVALPSAARADGDPASDALIAQNVFYPYSSPVPRSEQDRLNGVVSAAHRAGIDLKIALIARASDLGSIVALFGDPERYAQFLDTEISFRRKVPLLVVMPDGFGVQGLSSRVQRRVLSSAAPRGSDGAALAAAATAAVTRALRRADRPASIARPGGSGARSGQTILLLALILAALLVAGTLVVLRVFFPPTRT